MTDFFSLASEFVARSRKPSRLPGPFDNGKCEELGSRNNPHIAGVQARFESQLSMGRRSLGQNLVPRQSIPNFLL